MVGAPPCVVFSAQTFRHIRTPVCWNGHCNYTQKRMGMVLCRVCSVAVMIDDVQKIMQIGMGCWRNVIARSVFHASLVGSTS